MNEREMIARRAALELEDGAVVNLGIGIPTAVANYIPEGVEVTMHAENGVLAYGATPEVGRQDPDVFNAGAQPITLLPGAAIFDLSTSFGIIRGGHVDTVILGTLEVDQKGNLANWARELVPGKYGPGMGGAMELVSKARKVVVVTQHNVKNGESKILKECTLPLTGKGVVNVIVTEKAVFNVTPQALVLKEIAPGITVGELRAITDAEFIVAEDLCEYRLG
ncbi:MAG: 3-oxoacid CoA-transferase subunit B [Syntrophobacteraceae bacterium]|jgi:3-oxoacid CoA-transferase B subunit